MEKTITVKITSDDRNGADFESPSNCPLGRALKRIYPKAIITVFNNRVHISATKYTFDEGLYNEEVLKRKKGEISVTLIQSATNEKANDRKAREVERIK